MLVIGEKICSFLNITQLNSYLNKKNEKKKEKKLCVLVHLLFIKYCIKNNKTATTSVNLPVYLHFVNSN